MRSLAPSASCLAFARLFPSVPSAAISLRMAEASASMILAVLSYRTLAGGCPTGGRPLKASFSSCSPPGTCFETAAVANPLMSAKALLAVSRTSWNAAAFLYWTLLRTICCAQSFISFGSVTPESAMITRLAASSDRVLESAVLAFERMVSSPPGRDFFVSATDMVLSTDALTTLSSAHFGRPERSLP